MCSRTAINSLFSVGKSEVAYPLRAVFRIIDDADTPARFLISIPKRKVRTAVGRVLMRRRTREAYRLNRNVLSPTLSDCRKSVEIAFLYLDTRLLGYDIIEERMKALLAKIAAAVEAESAMATAPHAVTEAMNDAASTDHA